MFAHHAHNRQNRAFLGDGYGPVSDLCARLHGLCKGAGVEFLAAFAQYRTDPPQNLGQNNARVAPRALERALGDAVAYLHKGIGRTGGKLLYRRLHGERHVRARISVGNGKHVERVHLASVIFEKPSTAQDHLAEFGAVYRFLHYTCSFGLDKK